MKKAQILIRLEESLLMLIEAKALELRTSKQQWIQDLILRELACDIETTNSNDIADINDISTSDIVADIDILRNDISLIMDQIHQLGVNINRLDESNKNTKTEVERLGRINNGIREFALEQDERICDEVDAIKDSLGLNIQEVERLKRYLSNGKSETSDKQKANESKDLSFLESIPKISIAMVAEIECGDKIKAPLVARFFNKRNQGKHERTSDLSIILRGLEGKGYTPHFSKDKRTGEDRLSHFTFKLPIGEQVT